MSPYLRAPGRAVLSVLLIASACAAFVVARAEPASAACAGGNRTISGTVEGEDGRFVSAQVSIVLFDSAGRQIGMDGCVRTTGYATTTLVNAKPGTTCCLILPATGATSSPYTDSTGTYALTRNWSISGIPSNAVDVWIETYTKRSGGQPNTSTARFGHSMRRIGSITSAPIHIEQPLRCGLSGGGVNGSTGVLTGRVFDNGVQVTPSRVSAFSTSPDDGNGGSIIGFNVLTSHPSGRYYIDALPPGTYSIFVTAAGTTRRISGLRVNACADTNADVAVRGAVPAIVGIPVSGDWDGDGSDEPGVFINGRWYLRSDAGPGATTLPTFTYGTSPGDIPVVGDWDGDGDDEPGIYRRGGQWHLRSSTSTGGGTIRQFTYGVQSGDRPVVGDWDGDSDDEPGIYRRGGRWHLRSSSNTSAVTLRVLTYGTTAGDNPVVGDWDGDGDDEPGIYRLGTWHLKSDSWNGGTLRTITYGSASGDVAIPGNWDADAPDEPGIYRRGEWHLRGSSTAQSTIYTYRFPT